MHASEILCQDDIKKLLQQERKINCLVLIKENKPIQVTLLFQT